MFQRRLIALVLLSLALPAWPVALSAQQDKSSDRGQISTGTATTTKTDGAHVPTKKSASKGLSCAEPGLCGRCDCPPEAAVKPTDSSDNGATKIK